MTVNLMINKSEKNKITKSITTVMNTTGNIRNNTSITSPVFLIKGEFSTISQSNYVYVPEFKRYYYIIDMVQVAGNVTEISCHCDVLMSFKDEILSNTAVISRQESVYNRYLNDPNFRIYQNNVVITKKLSGSGFSKAGYVMAIAGQSK